ncbi:MAG: hypothetical protein R6W95_14505 [Desulfosarcina sp.]
MRHFPFKTLILCVLLPPLVYVFSIQLLERRLERRYDEALAAVYLGDSGRLFDGSVRLQEAVRSNVDAFLADLKLTPWGVRVSVTVRTREGGYLYPLVYDEPRTGLNGLDNLAVARENFRLLNEGLTRRVEVTIEHNTLLSNTILLACVTTALLILLVGYRRGMRMVQAEEQARQAVIEDLSTERHRSLAHLEQLESQRIVLYQKMETMKAQLDLERRKASATEDEMIDELAAMEDKIGQNLAQQDQQLQEIHQLKEKIRRFEKEKEVQSRQLRKSAAAVAKRFGTIYKNITFHDRAIEGFAELTEEMKIKAEEVIHQLNDDPATVQIKRKVFGKKNRETVFEVIFAYKGRLYFRNIPGNRAEVLIVGTKLTQNRDLGFLDKL